MANNVAQSAQVIDPMHAEPIGHGNSVAAWTLVGISLLGFLVGTIGFTLANTPVVLVGIVVVIAGFVAGWVMKKLGYGVGGPKSGSGH
ncbi:HGxxPAAW family protein [Paeniglutamicibacter cryotolerans]|uniref:Putative membrane-anchored protein n=1 Tax=Paeniglutamicibacter cryotolerans TaxID=670079 RepID=A0A839QQ49_9MICC|nr:HGxxPAAW family protein [Paeniglutamicibacter cryotolerans]MBB2996765.1 putative membrane-anchored protein [Paeniglutamicibacter cryotolerans]